MGSATRQALARARVALGELSGDGGLALGKQLFEAARVIADSSALRSVLADPSVAADDKHSVVDTLFSSTGASTRSLLSEIVAAQWSSQDDLLAGIEEIGIRAVASSAPKGVSIEAELFAVLTAVESNSELELAVGSKMGSPASKSALVSALLSGKASEQTIAIIDHLVQLPRGRRIGELVKDAADIVADQAGLAVATVISAAPITAAQLDRLRASLAKSYGRELQINQVIDPAIIGGIRVQIGDDVIDGSVSTRINDLRLQLAS